MGAGRDSGDDPHGGAAPFVPDSVRVDVLARAARSCTGCPLYLDTTQTVFGRGDRAAPLILVGEQPGDVEDRRGRPFVGPAGAVLWRCLDVAGIDSNAVYVTNAVKHFKHEQRGKRRLHQRPNAREIDACHPWLDAELRALTGDVVVALGAVAARSLFGRPVAISAMRGEPLDLTGRTAIVTYHPSAVLRAEERAATIEAALVADLRAAWQHCRRT